LTHGDELALAAFHTLVTINRHQLLWIFFPLLLSPAPPACTRLSYTSPCVERDLRKKLWRISGRLRAQRKKQRVILLM